MSERIQGNLPARPSNPSAPPPGAKEEPTPRRARDTVTLRRPTSLLERSGLPMTDGKPTNREMLKAFGKTAAKKLAKEGIKEIGGSALLPMYEILDGLNKIGKATFEGRTISEKRAFVAGVVETLYPALQDPSLTPEQAAKRGRDASEYQGTLKEIYAYKPGSHSTRFEHLKSRLGSHEAGVQLARRTLQRLAPEQRQELLDELRSELQRADPRYLGWSDQKAAIKEMFNLRVR